MLPTTLTVDEPILVSDLLLMTQSTVAAIERKSFKVSS